MTQVASDPMASALAHLNRAAQRQAGSEGARAAFDLWKLAAPELADEEARAMFLAESGFAGVARVVLDARLGTATPHAATAFPHLHASPLFSWLELDDELRAEILGLVDAHADDNPLELLGWLYQFAVPHAVRKRFGQFYTRRSVVRLMLDNVGFAGSATLSGRLIDPACGAGAYLIEATRRVLAAADEAGLDPRQTYAVVQGCIHGLDLNPLGVLLTEAAIGLLVAPLLSHASLSEDLPPLHLYVTDTLRSGELLESESTAELIKARSGSFEGGFEYVVANPPYAKYPSRQMTPAQLTRFSATTYGHPNLYGLFLQVGVELLADGGRLSFINPKSFVSGLYFRNLRRFLTQKLDLERFDLFDKRNDLFHGVLQEVVILTGVRSDSQRDTIELREFATSPDQAPRRVVSVGSSSVLLDADLDHSFFVSADDMAHRVLAKMMKASVPLSALGVEVVTGTIVWNRCKPLIRNEPSDDALPLVWGNGIRWFRFERIGNRAGEATHVAVTPKTDKLIARGEGLLVKRMTAKEEPRRIVACRIPDSLASSPAGYYAENHVNVIRPKHDVRIDLDAVLGLLNSDLFDYIFRALNGNTQVSATELAMMPIVEGPQLTAIAAQARALTRADGNNPAARAKLNRLVCDLYGLDERESAFGAAPEAPAVAS